MADEEDYNIENVDAGASATIPMEAGQIKKGGCVTQTAKQTKKQCPTHWQRGVVVPFHFSHLLHVPFYFWIVSQK